MPTFPRLLPVAGVTTTATFVALIALAPATAAGAAGTAGPQAPAWAKPAPAAAPAAPAGARSMARRGGALRGVRTAYVVVSHRTMTRTLARSVRRWTRARANRRVTFVTVGYRLTRAQTRTLARAGRWRTRIIGDPTGRITGRMKVRSVPALITVSRRGKVREVRFPASRRQRVPARLRPAGKRVLPRVPRPARRRAPAPVAPTAPAASPAPTSLPAPPPGKLVYRLTYGSRTVLVDGRPSIRAVYEAGSAGGGAGLGVWGDFAPIRTARLRYGVKFDPGFSWGGSVQKLPGLGGGDSPTGGESASGGWSARVQVDGKGGSATVTAYVYTASRPAGADATSGGYVVRGGDIRVQPGWNEIDYYVSMNSPGQANGVVQVMVNGLTAVRHDGIRFHDSALADEVLGESFFGGQGTSPQTQGAYFTEMEVYDG